MIQTLKYYAILARLNKPIGLWLLLWPTLWGLWLAANKTPDGWIVFVFILGVILMRSAGCVMNDIADRNMDGFVKRTKARPLVTHKVSLKEATILFLTLLASAGLLAILMLNTFTIQLSLVGACMAILYPFMKRFTYFPQVGLGIVFSWGIPMAFAAQTNTLTYEALVLFFAAVLWPVMYDTLYAMTDRDDDLKIGVKSTAILFGRYDKIIIGSLQAMFLLLLMWVGFLFDLNVFYFLSLAFVGFLFIYQQYLIRLREPMQCFKAFLNNNWVGAIIFVGILFGKS